MARNQPFDFSEDDDLGIASDGSYLTDAEITESGSTGITGASGMHGENLNGEAARQNSTQRTQTRTASRSTSEPADPTSMNKKRGNQPR